MDIEGVHFDGVRCSGTTVIDDELELIPDRDLDLAVPDRGVFEIEVPDVDDAERRPGRGGDGDDDKGGGRRGGDPHPHAP
jgi:hypothetical protein